MSRSFGERKPRKRLRCPSGHRACFVVHEMLYSPPDKRERILSDLADSDREYELYLSPSNWNEFWDLDDYYDYPDVCFDPEPVPEIRLSMSERLTAAKGCADGKLQEEAT